MYFELRDGKAFFAKYIIKSKDEQIYVYSEEEKDIVISKINDYIIEKIEEPTQYILERAKEIEGATLSKSEFERKLYNKTEEEMLNEKIQTLGFELAKSKIENIKKDNIINTLGQELAQIKIQLAGGY